MAWERTTVSAGNPLIQAQADEAARALTVLERSRPAQQHGLERRIAVQMLQGAVLGQAAGAPAVGRYRIEEKIGQGGMGVVYRATDPDLRRTVALKVVRVLSEDDHRRALREEARALARFAHPNVVSVHDVGDEDGQTYLVMEYVQGRTLRAWIEEETPRSWREILAILIDAGRGLAAAHAASIVHRDFKPENVLLGDDGRVRVADFGVAGELVDADAGTQGAVVAGTVAYMAPEVAKRGEASAASDQYSFCSTLRELLGHRKEQQVGQGEPQALWDLVERGLHQDPTRRHASMHALLGQLERILVARVADERRELVLDRVGAVLEQSRASSTLGSADTIDLGLAELPALVGGEQEPSARTTTASAQHDTSQLVELYDQSEGSLLIVGQPGAGKSTALRDLAQALVDRARRDATQPIPVVLNLASLGSHDGPAEEWVCDEVLAKYGIPARQVRARLHAEAWVLVLDGLDEVGTAHVGRVIESINALRRQHPCPLVVAGRQQDYEQAGRRLQVRCALGLLALDAARVESLCGELGQSGPSLLDGNEPASLATPLLLTLAGVSGEKIPTGSDESGVRARLYDTFVQHTLHDVPARDRTRMRASLAWLASTMRERNLSELWIERLQADWLSGRGAVFAARLLGVVALAVVAIGGNLLAAFISGRAMLVGMILGPASLPVILAFNRGVRVRPIDQLRWSWRRSLRRLPFAVLATTSVGVVYGLFYDFWTNVMAAVIAGFIIAYPLGLESSDEVLGLRPNRSIRRSAINAVVIGGVTTLLSGIALGVALLALFYPGLPADSEFLYLEHPYWAAFWVSGPVVGIPAGMVAGGTAVSLHGALRVVLAATSPLPLRLVTFLEQAVECGLLRRVGGAYVFPHRTLLEYLADTQGH